MPYFPTKGSDLTGSLTFQTETAGRTPAYSFVIESSTRGSLKTSSKVSAESPRNAKCGSIDSTVTSYELRIRPNSQWLLVEWRDIFAYRDLLWQLVRRDFTSRFKQTILGPLWYVINPLITTVLFSMIFGRVMGASPSGVPALLFFNSGLLAWGYFSGLLSSTGNTLQGNVYLFSKVYFPRLIVPIAQVFSNIIGLGVQVLTFLILTVYVAFTDPAFHNLHFGWNLLWLPLLLIHIAALALGAGLLLSAVTAKYRDLQNAVGFIINSLMFVTPVMWPLSTMQAKFPQLSGLLMTFNPLTSLVEAFRLALIGVGTFSPGSYAISVAVSILLLFSGLALFQRAARTFVDQA
jgi:lipopolysaccharide transport system permease protein